MPAPVIVTHCNCCGAAPTFEVRTIYIQALWVGCQFTGAPDFSSNADVAFLTRTETTSYPDLTGSLGAGWEAETQTIVTTWNQFTGAFAQSTSWSSTQTNFNNRAALGPDGVSSDVTTNNHTEYTTHYINPTTGEVFWIDSIVLGNPNPLAEVNNLVTSRLAALQASGALASVPWNGLLTAFWLADGSTSSSSAGAGGGSGMLSANLPLSVAAYPAGPYAAPFCPPDGGSYTPSASSYCVQAVSDIYTNQSFWTNFQDPAGDISDCEYTCLPGGSGLHLYSYDPPVAPGQTGWLAYTTSFNFGSVPSPCDGSAPPAC